MFCTTCGKKIQDGSRFCPFCGCAQGMPQQPGDSMQGQPAVLQSQSAASQEHPAALQDKAAVPPTQPTTANMASQVRQARGRSRGKIPSFLIMVLALLAITGVAFAAVYVYQTFIAPALEQSAPADEEAEQSSAEEEVEQSETDAVHDSADEDPDKAQRVAYNSKLSQYKQAQDSGWQATDATDDSTLQGLVGVGSGELNWTGGSVTADDLVSGDVEYAFSDINGDGTLELVVANLGTSGTTAEYQILGMYTLDGGECAEVQLGGDQVIMPSIYATGCFCSGYRSGNGVYSYVYELQGTSLVQVASWGMDASGTWVDDGSGQRVVSDDELAAFQQEYIGDGSYWTDFDWQPLSSFAPEE